MTNTISRTVRFAWFPTSLILLPGCMMISHSVSESSDRRETFYRYRGAAMSQRQVFVQYDVDRMGDRFSRCAAWEWKSMSNTNRPAPFVGDAIGPSLSQKGNLQPIPLIRGSEVARSTSKVPSAAVLVKDEESPIATLQLTAANGEVVRQQVAMPVRQHSRAAWGYIIMPFAWIADIVTFPVQAVYAITHIDMSIAAAPKASPPEGPLVSSANQMLY
jgi:hypothetical protein